MNKTLVGIFNREMTDKELAKLQGAAKDMNITPVEGGGYDAVLWWLKITDSLPSGIEPSLYQFQEGRFMEMLYMFDAKLVFACSQTISPLHLHSHSHPHKHSH